MCVVFLILSFIIRWFINKEWIIIFVFLKIIEDFLREKRNTWFFMVLLWIRMLLLSCFRLDVLKRFGVNLNVFFWVFWQVFFLFRGLIVFFVFFFYKIFKITSSWFVSGDFSFCSCFIDYYIIFYSMLKTVFF